MLLALKYFPVAVFSVDVDCRYAEFLRPFSKYNLITAKFGHTLKNFSCLRYSLMPDAPSATLGIFDILARLNFIYYYC